MFRGIDHVEFYVGNGYASAYFYARALGFAPLAESGLATGRRDGQSFVVSQGEIRFVFTNALTPDGEIAEAARLHGDSIRDVALRVDDAARAFERCVALGARPIREPRTVTDETGRARIAVVATFGDTVHSLVERDGYGGAFLPGFKPWASPIGGCGAGLAAVDHVASCVEPGTLARWIDFYEHTFGFHECHHEDVATDRSAMNSKVVESENGAIKLPLMEPAPGKSRSQIDEYLDYHRGAGAQHLALLSTDIVRTVRALREAGIDFLETPRTYYDGLEDRVGRIEEDVRVLRELNILVDRDRWGYLLQVFTRPVTGRPTGFLEIVQRKGAKGFGGGNVRGLFEAVEREQATRGNL